MPLLKQVNSLVDARLKQRCELKAYYKQTDTSFYLAAPFIYHLSDIAQGVADTQRVGDSLTYEKLILKYKI
jgi:hypothetical protein